MARLVLLFLVLLTACVGRPAPEASGEEIYLQLCSRCHGADLQGGVAPALGPGSNSATRPDSYLETTILRGRGRMPSFQVTLTPDQVDRLVRFLRGEQGE